VTACRQCGARWDQHDWTDGCETCGGGALERLCQLCDGRCGQVHERAVADSNDRRNAHWIGGCGLPPDEQRALAQAAYPQADLSQWTFLQATSPPRPPPPPRPVRLARAPSVPVRVELAPMRAIANPEAPPTRHDHDRIVAAMQAIAVKWQRIRETMAMDPEDGGWARGNARYATRVAAEIAAPSWQAQPTRAALQRAARTLIDDSFWDVDDDEPETVRAAMRDALDAAFVGSSTTT